jgi:hypothetical protein
MAATTMHTFAHCRYWSDYHAAYLRWMQRTDHPDLARSNYNALTWKDRNLNRPIPVIPDWEIYHLAPP